MSVAADLWPHVAHPRPYQSDAVDRAEAMLPNSSALVVLPTGCGKTVCFAELARRYAERGERVLVIAHREELIDQAAEKIRAFGGIDVGIEMGKRSVAPSGLWTPPPVVVGSVQSMSTARLLARYDPADFSLVVVDEAHHAAAGTYLKVLEHFSGAHVLGVTATPDRADQMALSKVFERVAYSYELRDAIEDGWLVGIKQLAVPLPDLDLSGIGNVAGDLNQRQLDDAIANVLRDASREIVRHAAGMQTLVFTPSVASARQVSSYLTAAGMPCEALDSGCDREVRASVVERYRSGELSALANCALFTEGFDVPEVSAVAILRPTRSRSLYAQMVGRGTRPTCTLRPEATAAERRAAMAAAGKSHVLILDFVGNSG